MVIVSILGSIGRKISSPDEWLPVLLCKNLQIAYDWCTSKCTLNLQFTKDDVPLVFVIEIFYDWITFDKILLYVL